MSVLARLFALVVLILLPIAGTEIFDEMDTRTRRAEEGKEQALRLVRLVAQEQARVIEGARQLLTAVGKTQAAQGADPASCNAFLADLAQSYPQYISLVNIDLSGHLVCAGGRTRPAAYLGERPYFKLAIQHNAFALGEFDKDDPPPQRAIYLAQPFYDTKGNLRGVVAAGLSLDWLNREIARNPLPPKATVSVIDRQGTVLARFPDAQKFVGTSIATRTHANLLGGAEGVQEALGFDGIARIYSYTPLPDGPDGLMLSVGLDKGELLLGAANANRRDILVIAGSFILALLLAAIGARVFIGRPIRVLLDAAEHWRQGDLQARVALPEARSEFGRLGTAFNAMAAAIGAREQELERRVEQRTEALRQAMQAQQAAEAALHDARKMETVGRLTGGVAHDFNNLLAAIVGNIELARARLGLGHPSLTRLDAAMESASRGAALTQQLLAFARRQNLRPTVVDLNRHVIGCQDMLLRLLRPDVSVEIALSPTAWLVRADPNQLEAAILNLAMNARDAMPHGGRLRLTSGNVRFGNSTNQLGLHGDFVALTVSDTGTGIPPEILEKVFEPFFTTKQIGAGSGLGLSMVQGFARQSSGAVSIDSVVGKGTSVALYLPRTTMALPAAPAAIERSIPGEGTILLVDDDAAVRIVTADLLEMSGYTVLTASTFAEAVARFEQEHHRIDILVADLGLTGGLDGNGLAAAIRSRQPAFPVLLITGHSALLADADPTSGIPVLSKPFDHSSLIRAVRDAISRAQQWAERLQPVHAFDPSK
jgi:signal transduction histidine kinase/CheY-like chemotaxis protein